MLRRLDMGLLGSRGVSIAIEDGLVWAWRQQTKSKDPFSQQYIRYQEGRSLRSSIITQFLEDHKKLETYFLSIFHKSWAKGKL